MQLYLPINLLSIEGIQYVIWLLNVFALFPSGLPPLLALVFDAPALLPIIFIWQIAMVVAGIGLLKKFGWARKLLIGLSAAQILLLLGRIILLSRDASLVSGNSYNPLYDLAWIGVAAFYLTILIKK